MLILSRSAWQSANVSAVLPEPTGPPIPTRKGAVPFSGTRRDQLRMCARPDPRRDLKVVTADDARQRMQQDRLATVIAFVLEREMLA